MNEVTQLCPTLCDPMDYSLPGSSIHGIFQARVLEWAATFFSRGSSWPRDRTQISCVSGRCFTLWATRAPPYDPVIPLLGISQFIHSVVSNSLNPTDYSTPGFPVLHQLLELAQTHFHRVGDAIQPSHPLSSPSSPVFNLSQHQSFF